MSYIEKSPWVIHYDGCGCGGCSIEFAACSAPAYDMEKFGIVGTDDPRKADVLLVTGATAEADREPLLEIYRHMAEPKKVVAAGECACSGGVFATCSDIPGGADSVLPVDVTIPGCAVRPEQIIDGILKAAGLIGESDDDSSAADESAGPDEDEAVSDEENAAESDEAAEVSDNEDSADDDEAGEEDGEDASDGEEEPEKEVER